MADIQNISLMCENSYEKYVTDRFGDDVKITPFDDDHIEVEVEADFDPLLVGWLAGLVDGIRVLGPGKVVDRMREVAEELDGVYGRDQTGREHLM